MTEEIPDFLERYNRDMRFVFEQNGKFMRLFFVSYQNDEFYLGSSLKKIICAGSQDVGEVIVVDNTYRIIINTELPQEEYKSLKFSFHKSGVRHLKCLDKNNEDVELYREKYTKLEELTEPEMLFTVISKRISLYQDYTAHLNKKDKNAIKLNTPLEYVNCRNAFEFYISSNVNQKIPSFIIPKENENSTMTPIKLKENLFLHIRFIVVAPNTNPLNLLYHDREILLFNDKEKGKLKFFSFK